MGGSSCHQEQKTHIIISEGLEGLTRASLKKDILLQANSYDATWTCLFDGRMTFEALDMEVSVSNKRGAIIKRDTLAFQLAKEKGVWCDQKVLVHEARANKQLRYNFDLVGIYQFRIKLLNHKNREGILALSLELDQKIKSQE